LSETVISARVIDGDKRNQGMQNMSVNLWSLARLTPARHKCRSGRMQMV
jgi:hypothetical protein